MMDLKAAWENGAGDASAEVRWNPLSEECFDGSCFSIQLPS